jgi:superfamily I DNA/RNA helicase
LRINYRTTEQIRRFASALLEGLQIDDLDGDDDPRAGYRSLTLGLSPEIRGFDSIEAEYGYIADKLRELKSEDVDLRSCCVVLRTNKLRDQFAGALASEGLATVTLGQQADNQSVAGVRFATMHRVKGLEFRHVFIAACSDGIVPNIWATSGSEDPVEQREQELSERALLHVASSRAIEDLFVTYHGKPSRYLE